MTEPAGFLDNAAMVASWSPKRMERAEAITQAARQLAADRGFDAFSLDELAEAAGVSRRTLFNYFPGKLDAVLGFPPQAVHGLIRTFVGGGPTGDLVEDAADVIRQLLEIHAERGELICLATALDRSPKLLAAAHRRFRRISEEITALIAEREGIEATDPIASAVISVLGSTMEASLNRFTATPDTSPRDVFDQQFDAIRTMIAHHLVWLREHDPGTPALAAL